MGQLLHRIDAAKDRQHLAGKVINVLDHCASITESRDTIVKPTLDCHRAAMFVVNFERSSRREIPAGSFRSF